MMLNSLKARVAALRGHNGEQQQHSSIQSGRVFRHVIRRERTRADRSAQQLALVVLDLREQHMNGQFDTIAGALRQNVRATDVVGWLERASLGVLLPDTNHEGAYLFCSRVNRDLGKKAAFPDHSVYVYPSDEADEDDGDGGVRQMHFATILAESQNGHSPNGPPAAASRAEVEPDSTARQDAASTATDAGGGGSTGVEQYCCAEVPWWKRVSDVVGAAFLLLLFSPLMLLIAGLIKLVSPGPSIFKQERIGYAGQLFTCFKFRTMHVDNDDGVHDQYFSSLIGTPGAMTKLDHSGDPRVFPFGKVLRIAALDELPQLFNVLRGEMSLIGPRPCIPYEYAAYRRWYRKRIDSLPGLTGLWQVSGKNRLTVDDMMRLDIRYSWKESVALDVIILLKTPFTILRQIWDAFAAWVEERTCGFRFPPRRKRPGPKLPDWSKLPST